MYDNSYQNIKDFIYKKLQDVEGILPKDKIQNEITNTKELMETIGLKTFAMVLSTDSISALKEEEWIQMQRELETHFDVEMDVGVLVQGDNQQHRDTTWWTGKEKPRNEGYYWERYKRYIEKSFAPEVVKTLDVDTDIIMDNIEDPGIENFNRYGMVVGHVQSGKTANYSGLICKAADAGYKFIVVIAGDKNNLRNQTQARLNESFVGGDKGIPVGVGKLGNTKNNLKPVSLTTKVQDFNKQDADRNSQGLNFDNIRSPIILVIKKHTRTLDNVISWLQAQYKNLIPNHAILLIDDESDYASINTKKEDDPTTINKKLRKLLSLFKKSAYVAYTATPYANIFIDHNAESDDYGKDLFPEDFIYALETPTNYFGAERIFLNSNDKHLIPIEDYQEHIPEKHKKDFELPTIPDSLYDAMRSFVINIALRYMRSQGNMHNSMLIHITRFTNVHRKISTHVENYIKVIKKDIISYGRLDNAAEHSSHIRSLKKTFDLRFLDIDNSWEEVLESICTTIETIVVREVHQSPSVPLEYRNDRPTNAIVIGGTSLSRGFTLEGLTVSYFLRNTVFYDTLMQMGRWFGFRPGYEDLCKIYMPQTLIDNFALIIEATNDLIDDLRRMSEAKMTPKDFGLAVKHHPESGLQVTARNKQKSSKDIFFEMNLDGHSKETSWIHSDNKIKERNLLAIRNVIQNLQEEYSKTHKEVGKAHLWSDIDSDVVLNFLDSFQVYVSDPSGLNSRMPIDFIKKYVNDVKTKWDVALYGGDSTEKFEVDDIEIYQENRKIKNRGDFYEVANRQVSSGNAESIVFDDGLRKKLASKRKDARQKMKKPLLMLHVLHCKDNHLDQEVKSLAAFGISFPGGVRSESKTIRIKINSVYIENLLKEEETFDD